MLPPVTSVFPTAYVKLFSPATNVPGSKSSYSILFDSLYNSNSSLHVDSSVMYFASFAFVTNPLSPIVTFIVTVASIIRITIVTTSATSVIPLSLSFCNLSSFIFSRTFIFFSCLL